MGAYGYVQGVILALELVKAYVASNGYAGLYFYAGREYGFDLLIQYFPWEAIGGDAVAQHAAQLCSLLEYGHFVAHEGEVVCCGKSAGAAAYNGYGFAGGLGI